MNMRVCLCLCLALLALVSPADEVPAPRDITVAFDAPTPAFSLAIVRVDRKDGEVAVLAEVKPIGADMVMQVITPLSATVRIEGPATRVTPYLTGKTWNWGDEEIQSVADEAAYLEKIPGYEPVSFRPVSK